ncbi:efflux RND transporter periplasmic adaptor subunit [Neolewinella lacunae]|uniref:Efflux RND transporter periplasmic adaptor subunit n=1 Tax=Neolewinella lacunae TaxID=1517758 RepID=A0A923T8T5_9BACT|nr:efflux RND transporter periplasmic adaptor subunit [Neolewinella lacunae]MBC6994871.1 efflux RND transporter periplasmic adaptor subunit [Neolewinella lacunae]MDN3636791.1 efflux RND transporter periplasmic adaptor subunit [Neolewinella lacunae]
MARKIIFAVLGLIILGIIGAAIFGGKKETGTRVFTSEAKARTIQEIVSASGKIFPQTEVKISSDVSGEVVELYVEEGDSVKAGQLLAKIDADAFQSQVARGMAGVNSSKAQLANSRAQIQSLEAQKAQIEAQLINAKEIYNRNKALAADGVVSQADLETSQASLRALEANLRAAESNIQGAKESARAAQFGVQSSEATLDELRTSLRRATIYAPMGGVISLLNVEEGERVVGTIQMAGTELMRIANLNAMEVRVEVSENDVPSVKIGDVAEVEVDAYLNRKFIGRVTQIANSSTTAGVADNVLNSDQVTNFEVRISIDPESYADLVAQGNIYPFRPGMSAGVDILTKSSDGVISVPIESVTTRQKKTEEDLGTDELEEVVFVVQGDTVRQVAVTTGLQDASFIELKTGVTPGEQVVAGPYSELSRNLKSGAKVVVKDKETFYDDKN